MSDATLIFVAIVVIYVLSSIKILREYERGVIFRLGRLLSQPKGPGVILVFAPIDRIVRVSLRIDTLEVPSQDVVTRDNVTVKVNAVIYFRVIEPRLAILDQHTAPWGVKVTMVEVKQVDLAEQMIRAIARQAEAERERRAKIIHAEGEYTAAEKLSMAAEVLQH